MAISIDTIYQRVLAIANKEQRGYVTPQEFNLFANQAQLEIFDQYFYDINQFGRLHGNDTEYSDMLDVINEKTSVFNKLQEVNLTTTNNPAYAATFGSELVTNGDFSSGLANWALDAGSGGSQASYNVDGLVGIQLNNDEDATGTSSTQAVDTVAGTLYKVVATVDTSQVNASLTQPNSSSFISFGGSVSNIALPGQGSFSLVLYFSAVAASTNLTLHANMVNNTADFAVFSNVSVKEVTGKKVLISTADEIYRLGSVLYTDSTGRFVELQRLLPNELIYVNSSALTKPDEISPAYVQQDRSLSIYPSSLAQGNLSVNYIIKPRRVNWAYNIVNEKAIFNSANAVNFMLHPSEEVTLVNKILEIAGVAMQKQDIQGFATGKDNKEVQQEKS